MKGFIFKHDFLGFDDNKGIVKPLKYCLIGTLIGHNNLLAKSVPKYNNSQ